MDPTHIVTSYNETHIVLSWTKLFQPKTHLCTIFQQEFEWKFPFCKVLTETKFNIIWSIYTYNMEMMFQKFVEEPT